MKILCLIDGLGSGGAQRQLVNLAVLLKKKHDITFTCYYDANFFEKQLTAEGIAIHWIKNKNALERIVKVRRFIKACDPDIVISYLGDAKLSILHFSRRETRVEGDYE